MSLQIVSCSVKSSQRDVNQWDFDHRLQFSEKRIDEQSYSIEIQRQKNTHFSQMSAFLLRRAYTLCQAYGFDVKILKGVEDYNDKLVAKSYIQPSLTAHIICNSKQ